VVYEGLARNVDDHPIELSTGEGERCLVVWRDGCARVTSDVEPFTRQAEESQLRPELRLPDLLGIDVQGQRAQRAVRPWVLPTRLEFRRERVLARRVSASERATSRFPAPESSSIETKSSNYQ
jgi:hypothetical protein